MIAWLTGAFTAGGAAGRPKKSASSGGFPLTFPAFAENKIGQF